MIGDWVVGGSEEPFKIGIIDPDFLHWDEVLPIPLTPDILEKNGFVYKEDDRILTGGFYQFVGEGKREGYFILIKFYDGTIGDAKVLVKIHTESSYRIGVNGIHSCDIEYVHELQHALRLCGIEKEIEL